MWCVQYIKFYYFRNLFSPTKRCTWTEYSLYPFSWVLWIRIRIVIPSTINRLYKCCRLFEITLVKLAEKIGWKYPWCDLFSMNVYMMHSWFPQIWITVLRHRMAGIWCGGLPFQFLKSTRFVDLLFYFLKVIKPPFLSIRC